MPSNQILALPDVDGMKTVWVVEPYPDGTCRVYSVTTRADGGAQVGEPFWHWTTMVLDGHPAYDVPEPDEEYGRRDAES